MTANSCNKFAAMIAASTTVMSSIRRNLFIRLASNLIGIPIAAGVPHSIFSLLISPMKVSATMTFSLISVILNDLRLSYLRL